MKTRITLLLSGLLLLSWGAIVHAEMLPTPEEVSEMKTTALAMLAQKLTGPDGMPVAVLLLEPIDRTAAHVGPAVAETLKTLIAGYGIKNVQVKPNRLKGLTVLQLRKALRVNGADLVMVPMLENTTFDLYLYDRRSPYALYAHSQPLSQVAQLSLSNDSAAALARVLLRRTLYHYIHEQYFELPHKDTTPYLDTEIPRWIASNESIAKINRDNESRFYASVTLGAALSAGNQGELWNSNLLGLQVGYRMFSNFYLEGAARTFSYNAFSGELKYLFTSRDTTLRLLAGAGFAYVTSQKVWTTDPTQGLVDVSSFMVGSLTLEVPVGDVYLVVDGNVFASFPHKDYIFAVAPGLKVRF